MDAIFNIQQVLNGLQLGAIYALLALGYTLVFGTVRLINFAHGDFLMVGAYSAYGFSFLVGAQCPLVLLLAAMAGGGAIALLANQFAYRPLRYKPRCSALVTAMGVSMFLECTFSALPMIGPSPRAFPEIMPWRNLAMGISNHLILDLAVVATLMGGLALFIHCSILGKAMRAIAQDKDAARLMGIDVERIVPWCFFIGGAFAGVAGFLTGMSYPRIQPNMGVLPGLKAFVAAVLGGIGSVPGAALGGMVMGLAETFATAWHSALGEGIAFLMLILVLLARPNGLLGRRDDERV